MYKKIMRVLLSIAATVVLVSTAGLADTSSTTVSVTVTPGGVTAGISVSSGSYDFGAVDLAKSSVSATGIILTNEGSATSAVDKTVDSITEWTLAESTGTIDEVVFWNFSQELQPSLSAFKDGADYSTSNSSFSTTTTEYNALNDSSGNQIILDPEEGATSWYRIDIPNQTSTADQKSITVRYKVTTQ